MIVELNLCACECNEQAHSMSLQCVSVMVSKLR